MDITKLLPETDHERMMCGALMAVLRGIPLERDLSRTGADWTLSEDDHEESWVRSAYFIPLFKNCNYRLKVMQPEISDAFWALFPNVNFVAKDHSGKWYGYKQQPVKCDRMWEINKYDDGDSIYFGFELDVKNGDCAWWNSLIIRPDYKE